MRGVILAYDSGTQLWPLTRTVSKALLPVYDKPMIQYSLATLMSVGIREVRIMAPRGEETQIRSFLGDGSALGIDLSYAQFSSPSPLPHSDHTQEDHTQEDHTQDAREPSDSWFESQEPVVVISSDVLLHGSEIGDLLRKDLLRKAKATEPAESSSLFVTAVRNPSEHNIAEVDSRGYIRSLDEQPHQPQSALAATGLSVYRAEPGALQSVLSHADSPERLLSFDRELIRAQELCATVLSSGTAWLRTDTFQALLQAGEYVQMIQTQHGINIGAIEEIAWRQGWIDTAQLKALAASPVRSGYGSPLMDLILERP